MGDASILLGLDVGGTKCACVVGTSSGEVLDRVEWPSQATRGPEAMIADFVSHGRALLAKHRDVAAVGVSIGGPLDCANGVVLSPPNLPRWDRVPLKATLERELGLP